MSEYTPITTDMRLLLGCFTGLTDFERGKFTQLCDAIDAVHAQLERENESLKAELDRVLGEQEDERHTAGESITGELREVAAKTECANGRCEKLYRGDLEHIADRIDAEHERAVMSVMNDALYHANEESMAELGWVRLPKDENGESFHIGELVDEMLPFGGYAAPAPIDTMELYRGASGYGWMVKLDAENRAFISPKLLRHHHAPTVEDVLREFALKVAGEKCMTMRTDIVEEYAAKLREVLGE